jgi:cellulose synthase operon protein YhjQ
MQDRKAPVDEKEIQENVATQYPSASLRKAHDQDPSASLARTRNVPNQRMPETMEIDCRPSREETEAQRAMETQCAVATGFDARQVSEQSARQSSRPEGFTAFPASPNDLPPRSQRIPIHAAESVGSPAWLATNVADPAGDLLPQALEDTLQGSRDRLTSRWFALRGVFEEASAPVEAVQAREAMQVPVLAVFSLAGGVGKTSLVATLGRALSTRGERVLLLDTSSYELLPFFFGARDQRPGVLRTFSAPGASGETPIQVVSVDMETKGPESADQETLVHELSNYLHGASRVLVDLAAASCATTRWIMQMSPIVLVPMIPDMNAVVSVNSIDAFFQRNSNASGGRVLPYFILNQFDPSLPLHLDVREVLREQLGDSLLPFVLHRGSAVSEALAEGMTVMDYAPHSVVAEDFATLAEWVKSITAPAAAGYNSVRWSEK